VIKSQKDLHQKAMNHGDTIHGKVGVISQRQDGPLPTGHKKWLLPLPVINMIKTFFLNIVDDGNFGGAIKIA
jgi:hypothetical protein